MPCRGDILYIGSNGHSWINASNQENIIINGQGIENVEEFVYLRAKVCKEGGGMKDLKNRLTKARGAFNKLKKIWISNNISRKTKLKLYKTLVLYGSETWNMNKGDDKVVNLFHNRCLRKILRIRWQRATGKSRLEATECGSDAS